MRVGVFALGSAFKFKPHKIKRSDGSAEYYKMVRLLARRSSIKELVILSPNEWDKLDRATKVDIDPRGVVVDGWGGIKNFNAEGGDDESARQKAVFELWEQNKDKPIDWGVGFISQGYETNAVIPGWLKGIKDPTKKSRQLWMTLRYASPIVHYLNNAKCPWFSVLTDPRYERKVRKSRDTVNLPMMPFVGQYDHDWTWEHADTYDLTTDSPNIIVEQCTTRYTGIEALNFVHEKTKSCDNERSKKFSIIAMQVVATGTEDGRLEQLKKWVLDRDADQSTFIYGKWDEFYTKQYPWAFKGFLSGPELDELFHDTRYTLMLHTRLAGWATWKFYEMLGVGCMPFMHPNYDDQFHLVPKDHFLRVYSPEELEKKMQHMEEHPDERIKMVTELQQRFLGPNVLNGDFVATIFDRYFKRYGHPFRIGSDVDETVNSEFFDATMPEPEVFNLLTIAGMIE